MERNAPQDDRPQDTIDDENAQVIIAGFGRFGQIAGRLLLANNVHTVVLDHDPDHIETLRKFGTKVFYGDATRVDLLESAGAAQAKVLINAIDDVEANLQLTALAKEHFPNLKIIARARDVDHWYQLRQLGVEAPERELFEGSLRSACLSRAAYWRCGTQCLRNSRWSLPAFSGCSGGTDRLSRGLHTHQARAFPALPGQRAGILRTIPAPVLPHPVAAADTSDRRRGRGQ